LEGGYKMPRKAKGETSDEFIARVRREAAGAWARKEQAALERTRLPLDEARTCGCGATLHTEFALMVRKCPQCFRHMRPEYQATAVSRWRVETRYSAPPRVPEGDMDGRTPWVDGEPGGAYEWVGEPLREAAARYYRALVEHGYVEGE